MRPELKNRKSHVPVAIQLREHFLKVKSGNGVTVANTMKKGSRIEDICFDVDILDAKELFMGFDFAESKGRAIFLPDKNKVINLVSESYSLLKNSKILLPIYDFLVERYGHQMIETKYTSHDDKKFYVEMIVNNKPYNILKGDLVNPTIKFYNSYDGSMPWALNIGFNRVVCTNGMMAFEKSIHLSQKHSGKELELNIDLEKIEAALLDVDLQLNRFKKLTERILLPKEVEDIKEAIREKTSFPKKLLDDSADILIKEMRELNIQDPNCWLAYNSYNYILNHADIKMHEEFRKRADQQVMSEIYKLTY